MITRLRVQNFRKHADKEVVFANPITVITGPNGSGKTSLIEAIYIALQGKSWRSNFDDALTQHTHNTQDGWWRVDLEFEDGEKRTVKYQSGQKQFEINGQASVRLPQKSKKPVILFEPNDLQLVYGSPTQRREFFDRFIAQIEPGYTTTIRKFERVLRQRNNLLRRGTTLDELFVWDVQFAELGEKIIAARMKWVDRINTNLSLHYQGIADNKDYIGIKYVAPQKTSQQLLNQLNADFVTHWPYTKTGPQSHDIRFKINGREAKQTASRGENRTILFGVLGAMTEIMNEYLGQKVYLIFDDVDSELDDTRKDGLYNTVAFRNNYLYATTIKASKRSTGYLRLD